MVFGKFIFISITHPPDGIIYMSFSVGNLFFIQETRFLFLTFTIFTSLLHIFDIIHTKR